MAAVAAVQLLPSEYGYVILVLVLYVFLNYWMGFQVGKARRKYKVFYPTMYAFEAENKDAKLFNCVQRGHQRSLEWMPMFFVLMVLVFIPGFVGAENLHYLIFRCPSSRMSSESGSSLTSSITIFSAFVMEACL